MTVDRTRDTNRWDRFGIDRAELLCSLVRALLAIGAEDTLGALVDHALACDKYDLTDEHLEAIFALEKRLARLPEPSAAIARWIGSCRTELERRTAQPPQPPSDYRRASELSCDCADCRALARFLADPDQPQARFPLAKARRQHLHQIIDENRCDCTHVTARVGRPFTLVCTKTTASYEAACKIHQRDLKNLKRLVAIEAKCP